MVHFEWFAQITNAVQRIRAPYFSALNAATVTNACHAAGLGDACHVAVNMAGVKCHGGLRALSGLEVSGVRSLPWYSPQSPLLAGTGVPTRLQQRPACNGHAEGKLCTKGVLVLVFRRE
jgi:hypothetical protein